MRLNWILSILLFLPAMALGAIEVHEFESAEQQQRFEQLTAELRCPKCQNQNIAASNAPIAEDMREQVYQRIRAGQSDEEIIGAMVERFGEFVHYRPPLNRATLLLWFGPVLLGLAGILIIAAIVRRSRRKSGQVLSMDERARVESLLREPADRPESERAESDRPEPHS
jgi:cytochrome c-type biogenesis protein CcmH